MTTASAVQPSIDNGRAKMASIVILTSFDLELLAEIFGRASDHQPGDEQGDDRHQQHAVETGADAADR